jgi:protein-tyrosine kinase
MGKIQEALKRLQSEGTGTGAKLRPPGDLGPVLARIAAGNDDPATSSDNDASGPVVEIDQKAMRNAGLFAPDYDEQMLSDQYRNIKAPLIALAYGKRVAKIENGTVIAVTSAVPGEGKSFTAMNLAISIAQEQDFSVLLVDADVVKPHISNVFALAEQPGLLDLLDGSADSPEALVMRTDMRGLSILPAGKPRQNATELLSGSRMEFVIHDLATRFPKRIIILDTPPILHTSESRVITSSAGQIVLVVKAEDTPRGAVQEALEVLGENAAVNLVLNHARNKGSNRYFGYGYGITSEYER